VAPGKALQISAASRGGQFRPCNNGRNWILRHWNEIDPPDDLARAQLLSSARARNLWWLSSDFDIALTAKLNKSCECPVVNLNGIKEIAFLKASRNHALPA